MVKVSKRGTITIPVHIRRQLNIQPGDEVEFEVTDDGRVILRVIPRASAQSEAVTVEEEESAIEAALGDTIDYLVTQQFYEYKDTIVDRTNTLKWPVPGSDRIITLIKRKIAKILPIWEKQGFESYAKELCATFGSDYQQAMEKIKESAAIVFGDEANPNQEEQRQFYLTRLLNAVLTEQRTIVNTQLMNELLEKLKARGVDPESAIDRSSNIGLPDFTLLENFRYLKHMAKKFGESIQIPDEELQYNRVLEILGGKDPDQAPSRTAPRRI